MRVRRAFRRYFAEQVTHAPFREPPLTAVRQAEGIRDGGRVIWTLGCAAALALMVLLPGAVSGAEVGSRALGARVAGTLESGVMGKYGALALQAVAASSPFSYGRIDGGRQ